jgi:hypothetical protein
VSAKIKEPAETSGIIGSVRENGFPVVYALVPELPAETRRSELPHLAVVSWNYAGSQRNGMPDPNTNERMLQLERTLSETFEEKVGSAHAYHRTGNGLKEFAYYVSDPGAFMTEINRSLRGLPRFPIDIKFYLDEEWSDFRETVAMFTRREGRADA